MFKYEIFVSVCVCAYATRGHVVVEANWTLGIGMSGTM